MRFRAEVLESLVQLYLRLNGYFCVPNYLQHKMAGFGLHTESDVLGLRMPHQHEPLEGGGQQQNDPNIVLAGDLIDCVIAEVKEASVEFNKSIRGNGGAARIEVCLRMFGAISEADFAKGGPGYDLARDLHGKIRNTKWPVAPQSVAPPLGLSVRMIVFAPAAAKHASERQYIDLQHVLDFTRKRMQPAAQCAAYRDSASSSGSPWLGLTTRIVEVLDASWGNSQAPLELEELIQRARPSEPAKQ